MTRKYSEDQVKAIVALVNEHGGYERTARILEQYERNMEYRKDRNKRMYSKAKAYDEAIAAGLIKA